jgi:hypothetical protein
LASLGLHSVIFQKTVLVILNPGKFLNPKAEARVDGNMGDREN